MLLQWHVKSPGSFCLKCRWQITFKHTYTLDPSKLEWADYAAVLAECGNLSHNPPGNTSPQWSQLAELPWTELGVKSGTGLHKPISTLKTAQMGNEWLNIFPRTSQMRKKPLYYHLYKSKAYSRVYFHWTFHACARLQRQYLEDMRNGCENYQLCWYMYSVQATQIRFKSLFSSMCNCEIVPSIRLETTGCLPRTETND